MLEPIALSTSQQFELERLKRVIEATSDPSRLQKIAKDLLQAWQTQKAATLWVMQNPIDKPLFNPKPMELLD